MLAREPAARNPGPRGEPRSIDDAGNSAGRVFPAPGHPGTVGKRRGRAFEPRSGPCPAHYLHQWMRPLTVCPVIPSNCPGGFLDGRRIVSPAAQTSAALLMPLFMEHIKEKPMLKQSSYQPYLSAAVLLCALIASPFASAACGCPDDGHGSPIAVPVMGGAGLAHDGHRVLQHQQNARIGDLTRHEELLPDG